MAAYCDQSEETVTNLLYTCRLCLNHDDELRSLFTNQEEISLVSLICQLTGLQPTEKDGSLGLCTYCCDQLSNFMNFRRLIQTSNAKLIKDAGSHVAALAESAEELNNKFHDEFFQQLPSLDVITTSNFQAVSEEEWSDEGSLSDPLERENVNELKLKKRDLTIPKAYYGLCNICGKEFKHLWRHLQSHDNILIDRCKVCGKEFKSKNGLQLHELMHKDALLPCDICGKKYHTKNRLKRHYRIHTNERPFDCNACGKKFYTKYNLDVHSRVHTGVKPYKCEFCGKKFTHSYMYKEHMSRNHLEILALKDP